MGAYKMPMLPVQPSSPPTSHRRLGWLLTVPSLGILALMMAVFSIIWLLQKNEAEIQKNGLIADVLWLEQDLRFRFGRDEEQLKQLAMDMGQKRDRRDHFGLHARHLLKNTPELVQVLVLSPTLEPLYGLPSEIVPQEANTGLTGLKTLGDQARRMGKAVMGDPFQLKSGAGQLLSVHPIFGPEGFAGLVIGVYGLNPLLQDAVPWWFAQRYRVRIVDEGGAIFAAKSNVEGNPAPGLSYDVPLDPPGRTTRLSVQSFRDRTYRPLRVLAGISVILGGVVIASLFILRQQMRRRLDTEQALRAEHAFRKSMEDSLTVGMRARDMQGKVIYVNAAFCHMTGFAPEELVGCLPPMPYWAPEDMEEAMARNREVLAGEASPTGFEIRLMRKSGDRFHALIFEAPLIDGSGQQIGWMASFVDVTERKQAEELYRKQQEKLQFTSRLVTMGEMASTLAHELNQPLSAITSYATGCLNRIESNGSQIRELKQPLEKLVAQAQRAGKIIRRVHDFVRRREARRECCDLNTVMEDALGLVEAAAKRAGVRLSVELEPELPTIQADPVMLEQVALNLMKNGMEAMAGVPLDERLLSIRTHTEGATLVLSVADRGSGIPASLAEQLFTPFMSTKEDGMGMGLNICRSIAELHQGRLWFEPRPGGGTVFHLSLPMEAP